MYYFTYMRNNPDNGNANFWVASLFLTGLILMAIGAASPAAPPAAPAAPSQVVAQPVAR